MIKPVDEENIEAVFDYLHQHEEYCQFLISNLNTYGSRLTDHHNSGNYKIIFNENGKITGVFCLTRRGNLLAQTDSDYSDLILDTCTNEPISLKGFIGDWKTIEPLLFRFKKRNPVYKPGYESKEILYFFSLDQPKTPALHHHPQVRFLEPKDFDQWDVFSKEYFKELHLPDDLNAEERRRSFLESIEKKIWWGLFQEDQLVSRVGLNSKGPTIGQVGGVFTPPSKRKKGYAKATMLHMLKDCRDLHGHNKSILFTGETDLPAQKLYETIGYKKIGRFALILG